VLSSTIGALAREVKQEFPSLSVARHTALRYNERIMNEANLEKIPHGVMVKIRALYNSLKSAERKFVDFILANPDGVRGGGCEWR